MKEFFSRLWENLKTFGRETYYFLSSRIFLKEFGKMLAIIAVLLLMLFYGLDCCTHHGDSQKVGNFVGKNMKEVRQMIDDEGLELVVTDSIFDETKTPDLVLEQSPVPNSFVKTGRTIYLKITKAAGDLVTLPDIAGRDDINFYVETLKSIGIKVGKIDTVPDPNLSDGTIKQVIVRGRDVYNELKAGVKLPQGSLVDFVVSKRQTNNTDVPNFIVDGQYKTTEEYQFLLSESYLKVSTIVKDATVTDEGTAYVIKVSPSKGTEMQKGDSVKIFITQKNPAGTRTDSFEQ